MSTQIHPTAVVDAAAQLGAAVKVGPFAVVERDVQIGDRTVIMAHAQVMEGSTLGADCQVHAGTVVGGPPQDVGYADRGRGVVIGDRTILRECVTVNQGTEEDGTVVGAQVYFMAYSHVGHDSQVGDHVILANGVQLGGFAQVGEYASIGGMTPVHQFCRVGAHAFVGGGYRVVQDVPPYILATGEPLRYAGLNVVGLRRQGFDSQSRASIKRAYRLIYRSEQNLTNALTTMNSELGDAPEIQAITTFIEEASRGII